MNGRVIGVVLLCVMVLVASQAQAARRGPTQKAELVEKTGFYQRTLTLPQGTSASQRSLLAAGLATRELGIPAPEAFMTAYQEALAFDDYLPISDTSYNWLTDHWNYINRTSYSYNGSELLIETITEQYNGISWNPTFRMVIVYNGNGLQTSITNQTWESTEWRNESRTLFEYDGSGKLIVTTLQTWDPVQEVWENTLRMTNTYASGLLETLTTEEWKNEAWSLLTVATYEYNAQNRVERVVTQADFGSGLENASLVENEYDGNGNLTKITNSAWSTMWMPTSQTDFTYDGSNREIIRDNGFWIGTTLTPSTSDTTKYDGDLTSETVHVSVFPTPGLSRTLYMYDEVAMTLTTVDQDGSGTLSASPTVDWVNTLRDITVYDEFATSVQINSEPWSPHYELGQNFPNPFNPTTVIHYSLHRSTDVEITVYNVLGQHVMTLEDSYHEPGVYETRWDGTDASGRTVSSGIYFYRLKTDEQVETRKMLLLK